MFSSDCDTGALHQSPNSALYSKESTPVEVEYASESIGTFFGSEGNKHKDLIEMLDSNKVGLKLEAMKRIIGMVAKGRDASDLFPAVVKNVVSKNVELKKLVYVYLERYAEEQQDLALLSISTFQRSLKDPNQLIRASALRVLSSIRVPMIVPIVMLAIRDSASDMSPYVRKTAAHAIPKLYSLDAEQKEELVGIIEKLLSDRTTLVVGSAVMAFEEVCPERVDLIHKNYRKLCNLIVDVDEWGQVIIINMLTRYARTQFTDPNAHEKLLDEERKRKKKPPKLSDSTSNSSQEEDDEEDDDDFELNQETKSVLDADHRLLLRQTKPLLQSRNASVVMAVAQLYHHVAPKADVQIVAKALVRLLRNHREIQSVVLTSIASMSQDQKNLFDVYIKSFFVRTNDPTHIKLLKVQILTNLTTETNISIILREFQTYIKSNDREFVMATIQAIGRCATTISQVTEVCLTGLVHMLSSKTEFVVAESVVVIKKLLQSHCAKHREIIVQMAKLLDHITVAAARAAIIWLIGEYNEYVKNIAPDVLRKIAETFVNEENSVKLQILTMSVKLYATNPEQTRLLTKYIFELARYDQNYDVRDRARFLKALVGIDGEPSVLSRNLQKIFLSRKPAPVMENGAHEGATALQLGSLSHYLKLKATGYRDLPEFPETAPDSSVRNVQTKMEVVLSADRDLLAPEVNENSGRKVKSRDFYSDESSSDDEEDDEEEEDDDEDSKEEKNDSDEWTEDESSSDETSSSSSESSSGSGDEGENDEQNGQSEHQAEKKISTTSNPASNLDLLSGLDNTLFSAPSGGVPIQPLGVLQPAAAAAMAVSLGKHSVLPPVYIPTEHHELLSKINGYGLGIVYRFTRFNHLTSPTHLSVELVLKNHNTIQDIGNVQVETPKSQPNDAIRAFPAIPQLAPNAALTETLGVDFNDSTQPISFTILSSLGRSQVSIGAPVGELIQPIKIPEDTFRVERNKLRGMTEHSCTLTTSSEGDVRKGIEEKIFRLANVAAVPSNEEKILQFAGQTLKSKSLLLITVLLKDAQEVQLTVNCEKIVMGSILLNDIKSRGI
ncbi:AP-3 complex subunit beta-2 [Lutzomyia longipalpis]|uniref:AP-3 complex subunit beta-2 n=1 Tax=Lutzomyia longipalpis TaxID=7200 RepID=UPI0024845356|nr:AP-3 complex subunit beta-2 [Lutzomyia longipalpis]